MPRRKVKVTLLCRKCAERTATRLRDARGKFQLCEKCWRSPEIRAQYLASSPYQQRGQRQGIGRFLDDPKLSDTDQKAKELLDALEGEECHCFDRWNPETEPWPDCPHVKALKIRMTNERFLELRLQLLPEEYVDRPLPPVGTALLPGSAEKIQLMRERVEQLLSPCHPTLDLRVEQCKEGVFLESTA